VGVEETRPLVAHQLFDKLAVTVVQQLVEVFKAELVFWLLQPPPTGGRLIRVNRDRNDAAKLVNYPSFMFGRTVNTLQFPG